MNDLERAIVEAPDDAAAYLVFADWLLAQSAPRGELILVQHALEATPDDPVLLEREASLLGLGLTRLREPNDTTGAEALDARLHDAAVLRWRRGFIHAIALEQLRCMRARVSPEAALRGLLSHPAARLVREFDLDPAFGKAADRKEMLALLRTLAPRLRTLRTWLHSNNREQLLSGRFDELESLTLHVIDLRLRASDLKPLLDGVWPRLTHLSIFDLTAPEEWFEALAASKLLPRLREVGIDVSYGDAGAVALRDQQEAYRHVRFVRGWGESAALYNTGLCLRLELRRPEDALAVYTRASAAAQDRDEQVWLEIGNACRELGRQEDAIAAFERAVEIRPDYVPAWNNLSSRYGAVGRHDDEIAALERALALRPDYDVGWFNLGVTHQHAGNWAAARDAFERARALVPSAKTEQSLGQVLQALGDPRAEETLRRAISSFDAELRESPQDPSLHYWRGAAWALLQCRDEALADLQAAARLDQAYVDGMFPESQLVVDYERYLDEPAFRAVFTRTRGGARG